MVTRLHIFKDFLKRSNLAFGFQFVQTPLGTHFRAGCHINLQFRIRKDNRTDIATIHHDPFRLPHFLLLGDHRTAYKT